MCVYAASLALTPPFLKAEVLKGCASFGPGTYDYTARAGNLSIFLVWAISIAGIVLLISLFRKRSQRYKIFTSLALALIIGLAIFLDLSNIHIC